jgi:hypothetical protein
LITSSTDRLSVPFASAPTDKVTGAEAATKSVSSPSAEVQSEVGCFANASSVAERAETSTQSFKGLRGTATGGDFKTDLKLGLGVRRHEKCVEIQG